MMFGSNVKTHDTPHSPAKYEDLSRVNFQFVFFFFLLLGDVFHFQFIHMTYLEMDEGN